MIYAVVALLIFAILMIGTAFIVTIDGIGFAPRPNRFSDRLIERLLIGGVVTFCSAVVLLLFALLN